MQIINNNNNNNNKEIHGKFGLKTRREQTTWKTGIDEKVIFKCFLKKQMVRVW
jgi:hypothetical protein